MSASVLSLFFSHLFLFNADLLFDASAGGAVTAMGVTGDVLKAIRVMRS